MAPGGKSLFAAGIAIAAGCLAGCSGGGLTRVKVHPVSGKVLFNGKPAEKAMVVFHPLGTTDPRAPKPLGLAGSDGRYRLTSYVTEDGAPQGDYAVTVTWPGTSPSKDADDPGPDRLHGRYANVAKSPLKFTVKADTNEFDINLR